MENKRPEGIQPKFLDKKHLFLTYADWKGAITTPEYLKELLEERIESLGARIEKYHICLELHADGRPHFHAYIKLDKEINKRGARLLDFAHWDHVNHPNIEPVRSYKRALKYIEKHGNFITNIEKNEEKPAS